MLNEEDLQVETGSGEGTTLEASWPGKVGCGQRQSRPSWSRTNFMALQVAVSWGQRRGRGEATDPGKLSHSCGVRLSGFQSSFCRLLATNPWTKSSLPLVKNARLVTES